MSFCRFHNGRPKSELIRHIYDFRVKTMFASSFPALSLRYLCLFVHSGVPHILFCVFVLFFIVLCIICHISLLCGFSSPESPPFDIYDTESFKTIIVVARLSLLVTSMIQSRLKLYHCRALIMYVKIGKKQISIRKKLTDYALLIRRIVTRKRMKIAYC